MRKTSAPVSINIALQPASSTTPARRKSGRRTKATPERLNQLRELLESGVSLTGACRAVGLGESTIYKWRESNPEIEALVTNAIGESERKLVALALDGAKKDGRVALMMLERRFPESWSKQNRHEHLHAHAHGDALSFLAASRERRDAQLAAEASRTIDAELVED